MAHGIGPLVLVLLLSLFICSCQANVSLHAPGVPGTDCTQIKKDFPKSRSGIYNIQPQGISKTFKVYCKMKPDGGWTVFQRRINGQVKFDRRWYAYKNGFGNLDGDHWLGLQKLWSLMRLRKWVMRVDLWDFEGGTAFAEYSNVKLGNESQGYKLRVGNYMGTAGDAIRGTNDGEIDQNGYNFSTMDHDNDGCSPCVFGDIAVYSCTRWFGNGGWWYSSCGSASLNGKWYPAGNNTGWSSGIYWGTWNGPEPYSAKATRMMIQAV